MQSNVYPELAEAMAIREVLSWVKSKQQMDMVVKTDCLQIVHVFCNSHSSFSYLGRVVEECRVLLAGLKHQNVVLRFVKRSVNRVAHYLVRYSCSIVDRSWRIGNAHPKFQYVLLNDLNN